jgi:methylenetetrahydrofolate dehydrogenase (NADP+)/methenyltetrahydrofolate cyclohydrolase
VSNDAPRPRIIDGQTIADRIGESVDAGVAELRAKGRIPHLVAIEVGQNEATELYIRKQKQRFSKRGMQYTHFAIDEATSSIGLLTHIRALNENPTVTGIILTMPLPEGIRASEIQEAIAPEKDVEGVSPANIGRLIYNRHAVGPCTALAIMEAIDYTGTSLRGKHVVIVGHSDIVGKPVGLCLLQELATITTCHVATRNLAEHTRQADVLVVAVGIPGLIKADMVRPGAIVIDVGINRDAKGRIVGDVAYDEVAPLCEWITPVPGGIGPITVAVLARNTLACARQTLLETYARRADDAR